MASISPAILVIALALLASKAESLTCTSQKFASKKTFAHCSDLAVLSAYLHWTYDSSENSLHVAFTAPPRRSDGWVAWAINPTGEGMAGAQAFIAAKRANGSVPVTTFNISSYSSIVPSKLSFEVLEQSAESSNGTVTIFASVKVPAGKAGALNHIWQVGPGFNQSNGFLLKHDFKPENLAAKGTLNLLGSSASPASSPSIAPGPSNSTSGPKSAGVSVALSSGNLISCVASILVLVSFFSF